MLISIEIDEETNLRLTRLAEKTQQSEEYFVHKILMEGLDDVEDYHLGVAALAEWRNGDQHTIPLAEWERKNDLAH
jgi:predicted DNA-binding protein